MNGGRRWSIRVSDGGAARAARWAGRVKIVIHRAQPQLLLGQRACHHLSAPLLRVLGQRHDVLFLERDQPWYAANRDLPDPRFLPPGLLR